MLELFRPWSAKLRHGTMTAMSLFVPNVRRWSALLLCLFLLASELAATRLAIQGSDWLEGQDRAELDLMLRRGELEEALPTFEELLAEVPGDAPTRMLYARALRQAGRYEEALVEARRAAGELFGTDTGAKDWILIRAAARELADLLLQLGRSADALKALDGPFAAEAAGDARERWSRGQILLELGRRREAMENFQAGAELEVQGDWQLLLAQARCQRALGQIEDAAGTLVAADKAARRAQGMESDVLVELGEVYFEYYGEVDDQVGNAHSPRELYDEALELSPGHEAALLGLYHLHRFNWNRQSRRPGEILEELFGSTPESIAGKLARASSALDNGDLRTTRRYLGELEEVAPGRRDVRIQQAALRWVDHDREEARAILDELAAEDAADSVPAREVGRHLLELYRFAEALPFLEEAVGRNSRDFRALRELGRAQANTGDSDSARDSLDLAIEAAQGRRDAWRDNMSLVLGRMESSMVEHSTPNLTFVWLPDAAFVLETYLEPFYSESRLELADRYGFTPDPVRIEVFRRWGDFSVRSTGFEGFPALGVCFGPVVTAVSPLARELRGGFSWARTSYHEFTHVIHLGLSHNRCPRWVTEGLATWEEGRRTKSWWRNYRRELVDARANGDLITVRNLNGAFRGSRVLFAYYQSGLLCKLLIEEHGFPAMVRLLESFDKGADLDVALQDVFQTTPEELDVRFAAYVDDIVGELHIEPRWSRASTFRLRFRLTRQAPSPDANGGADLAEWQDSWARVGWGDLNAGRRVDAEDVLRLIESSGVPPARALFLKGELALSRGDNDDARLFFEAGLESGGEDFRARMALGALAMTGDDSDVALEHLLAAEAAFPGFDDPSLSAELRIADHLERNGDREGAMAARLRWLDWNAGEDSVRLLTARWLAEVGRHAEALTLYGEANEVDPFRRSLHLDWAHSAFATGDFEVALRESAVGLRIPAELEREAEDGVPSSDWATMMEPLLELMAQSLVELGQIDAALASAKELLALDADNAVALEILGGEGQ
ncbi:MAG: tetratricopeptide (TPR) repeat protein [Planctomycetota bacterium]|jgi:tetratricopeptide (TPR) repeat protein